MFEQLGIHNFLEGDFFRWYIDVWNTDIADGVRKIFALLSRYDAGTIDAGDHRDLLKGLYQALLPQSIRHDLGEYYTPDWLADHVLNQVGYSGQPDAKLLDPACGSGTFLILAINRLREACGVAYKNEDETLQAVLQNIVGIDLNPLAVIAARANYVLAIRDLLMHRNTPVSIPVYLADSVVLPKTGRTLMDADRYEIQTVVGRMSVPTEIKTPMQIDQLCRLIESCLQINASPSVFLQRAPREVDWMHPNEYVTSEAVLRELYNQLLTLHRKDLDGIWTRIIRNAFMPLFIGRFDFVVGNPPWISWETLPQEYRDRTKELWIQYGLFTLKGFAARMGGGKKDFSMLMSYAVTDRFLGDGGKLGFLITQSVFKSVQIGEGFRMFRYGTIRDRVELGVEGIDDLTKFQQFAGASTQTASFVWTRGTKTVFPVPYRVWSKVSRGSVIDASLPLTQVLSHVSVVDYVAEPVNPRRHSSHLLHGLPAALDATRKMRRHGQSGYTAHAGVYTGANAVYWVDELQDVPGGLVLVQNRVHEARVKVPQIQEVVEKVLVHPLVKGRNIRMWHARPEHSILIVQDAKTKRGITEDRMQADFPRAYRYLQSREEVLRSRAVFRKYYTREDKNGRRIDIGPYYSMMGIGEYTLLPHKVVWKGIGRAFTVAAIISSDRIIVTEHNVMTVSVSSAEEAYYLAGMLGSAVSQFIAANSTPSLSTTTKILHVLPIPRYDAGTTTHRQLAQECERAHQAAAAGRDYSAAHQAIEPLAASVYGVPESGIADIRASYRSLL